MTLLRNLTLLRSFTFSAIRRGFHNICNGRNMPTGDAYSSGHLVLSYLGLACVLMSRLVSSKLVMLQDFTSIFIFYNVSGYSYLPKCLFSSQCFVQMYILQKKENVHRKLKTKYFMPWLFIHVYDFCRNQHHTALSGRGCLLLRTPGSVLSGTCMCSNVKAVSNAVHCNCTASIHLKQG